MNKKFLEEMKYNLLQQIKQLICNGDITREDLEKIIIEAENELTN